MTDSNVNQGAYALKSDCQPRPVILAFRGENFFLSNMAQASVTLPAEGNLPEMDFDSTEKAYMAWKTLDVKWRQSIRDMTAKDAKKEAHKPEFPFRQDYSDEGRLDIMLKLNRQKYSIQNPELREKLLSTDDTILIEGNDWGDTFFGFSYPDGWGQNHLGRILMQVRDEIKSTALTL